MNAHTYKNEKCHVFWAKVASFSQGVSSLTLRNFTNPRMSSVINEVGLMNSYNLSFWTKLQKKMYTRVFISWTCTHDKIRDSGKDIKFVSYFFQKRELMEKQENWKPLTPVMEKSETLKTKEQVLTVIDTTLLKCYLSVSYVT